MHEIKDYFLIGNLYSAALVSKSGSIDWLCLPYFDSASVFGKILDNDIGGSFSINTAGYELSAEYETDTAIVKTDFHSHEHSFSVTDLMPIFPERSSKHLYLIRNIRGRSGSKFVEMTIAPRPNYGKDSLKFINDGNTLKASLNGDALLIHLPQECQISQVEDVIKVSMEVNDDTDEAIVLEYIIGDAKSNYKLSDWQKMIEFTQSFWKDWVNRHTYVDFAKDLMVRSAITLKLMQFQPTGAIIASPTTSLPETFGGPRNWDYRYVWMRDATFTLYSLMILGCKSEAVAFFEFLEKSVGWENKPQIELMYTIHGERVPEERELAHLRGYADSSPVRIGNDAVNQFQLDVFGTLIDAIYFAHRRGIKMTDGMCKLVMRLLNDIDTLWNTKDQGIWEMRTVPRHFTHSKVVCWVGVNRAIRMADALKLTSAEIKKLTNLENEIREWIYSNCLNENQELVQHPETDHQDSTNYLFVILQFLDKNSPKTKEIIKKTSTELLHDEVFVYRYITEDGFPGDEGALTLATFWLISALAITGDVDKAIDLFKKLENKIAESGLLSEEMDVKTLKYVGNFPQAFSHMGLIMSAYYIDKYQKK